MTLTLFRAYCSIASAHRIGISLLLVSIFSLTSWPQSLSPQTVLNDSFGQFNSAFSLSEYWGFRWNKNTLSTCNANPAVTVDYDLPNQRLQIVPVANASGNNFNGFRSKFTLNYQNGYVQAETLTSGTNSAAMMSVGPDCNNWYRVYRNGSTLSFQSKIGGALATLGSITFNSDDHRYWRIRHQIQGDQIVFETGRIEGAKEKKLIWTQRTQTTRGFSLAQVSFELSGGTASSTSSPTNVLFDNFLFDSNAGIQAPQQFVDISYPVQTGIVRAVTQCSQIQSTLDAAQPGDTVTLSPALTCTGNYTLPAKTNPNNKWIIVRSASTQFDSNGTLRPGRRADGDNAAHTQEMPKLYTLDFPGDRRAVLSFPAEANYYRIIGIEMGVDPSCLNTCTQEYTDLVAMEASANQVNHVIIDRCYIHGEYSPGFNVRRGVSMNGAHLGVINSTLSKIVDKDRVSVPGGALSQTKNIGSWSGYGPLLIENNFLETVQQSILIGGASSSTPQQVVSDVIIRKNYFTKRDALFLAHGCNSTFTTCPDFGPANGIELKTGRRVEITENIFDQTLAGILVKTTAETDCIACVSEHIRVQNNRLKNVNNFMTIVDVEGTSSSSGINGNAQHTNHVFVNNNLAYFTYTGDDDIRSYDGSRGIFGLANIPDLEIAHNTIESKYTFWGTTTQPGLFNFIARDNILERGPYGLGIGGDEGAGALNQAFFPWAFRRNILVNNSEGTGQQFDDAYFVGLYPCTSISNSCIEQGTYVRSGWDSASSDGDQIGFVQPNLASRRASGNYRLASNSLYKNAATDGTDIGVNQDALDAALCGVTAGNYDSCAGSPIQAPFPGAPPVLPTTIEIENYDSGGEGVSYHDSDSVNDGNTYRTDGVDIRLRSFGSNGHEVFNASAGEWMEYTVNVPYTRLYDIGVRYASDFNSGTFHIEDCGNDPNNQTCAAVNLTGTLTASSTGGWNSFRVVTKRNVQLTAGTHVLRIRMDANSPNGCNCVVADFDAILFKAANFDFDSDGRSDIGVFRPSDGNWYINRSRDGFTSVNFGLSTDVITPGDFDGDGKADQAVSRGGTAAVWWVLNSSNNQATAYYFGTTGDIPVQADYDGDHKTDFAVWRPSNGTWYVVNSNGGAVVTTQFGSNGDKPAVGDYDRDGKSDYAVFRPSTAIWHILGSTIGAQAIAWGISTDTIVPGDYDADGRTEIGIWRSSTGLWGIYNIATGAQTFMSFGLTGDVPSPADFDGDGKLDWAVFRPSNGIWYIQHSTEGFGAAGFGTNGDIPIQSTYVR